MEPDSDGSSPIRPALPVSGEIVGVLSVMWGLWIGWKSVQEAMAGGLFPVLPAISVLVHAGMVVAAILYLQRKGIGRQFLIIGLWCSAILTLGVVLLATAFAIGFGGLISTVGGDTHDTRWLLVVRWMSLAALPALGALSLHRRSVRDAMEPPAIILLRKSVLEAQIPDADRD